MGVNERAGREPVPLLTTAPETVTSPCPLADAFTAKSTPMT